MRFLRNPKLNNKMNQMLETISQPVLAISEDTLIIDVLTLFQQNDCLNILPLIARLSHKKLT